MRDRRSPSHKQQGRGATVKPVRQSGGRLVGVGWLLAGSDRSLTTKKGDDEKGK